MKQITTLLSVLSTVGVLVLFGLHFSDQSGEETPAGATTLSESPSSKIAYVNIDTLLTYYKFYEDITFDYREKRTKQEKQLQTRFRKLENEVANAQKRAQAGLMSQNDMQKTQQDIAYKEQELASYQRSLREGLLAEEQNLTQQLNEKVSAYLEKYNEGDRFELIFSYGAGSPIMLATDALDITQVVLDGLNKEYEENKGADSEESE